MASASCSFHRKEFRGPAEGGDPLLVRDALFRWDENRSAKQRSFSCEVNEKQACTTELGKPIAFVQLLSENTSLR